MQTIQSSVNKAVARSLRLVQLPFSSFILLKTYNCSKVLEHKSVNTFIPQQQCFLITLFLILPTNALGNGGTFNTNETLDEAKPQKFPYNWMKSTKLQNFSLA